MTDSDWVIFFLTIPEQKGGFKRLQEESTAPKVEVLAYEEFFAKPLVPRGTYVFTSTDQLSTAALTEAARLYRRLHEHGCRVLNDPARVRARFALLRALHQAGINPINVYLVEEGARPKQFPVFIRIADAHNCGPLSDLIWDQTALDSAVEAAVVAGFPRSTILIVEYAAQPIIPGVFGKASVYRVGDRFIPDIWWYGKSWYVTGDRDGLVDEEFYKEELRMMHENRFAKDVAEAFALANIDYGRVDFGLVDDGLCIYEINTDPLLFGPRSHPLPQRVESLVLRWTKLVAAFHAIDTDSNSSQELIDITGTSIQALTQANIVSRSLRLNVSLSKEHRRRGNLAGALESAEAAVAAEPNSLKALANLSRVLAKHDRVDDAISVLTRVVEASPRATRERHRLATLLLKTGRLEDARNQLLEALVWEDHWKTNLLLSRIYKKLGDNSAALGAARHAAELASDESSAREWLHQLRETRPRSSSRVPKLLRALKSLRPS